MATITYTFGKTTGNRGTAAKDGLVFEMRELEKEWKLIMSGAVTIEYKYSKKDFPTFEEWTETLIADGYEIKKGV